MKKIAYLLFFTIISSFIYAQNGNCLEFDGTDDYVAIETMNYSVAGEITELTVCAWVLAFPGEGGWSIMDFDRSEYYNVEIGWHDQAGDVINFNTYSASGDIHDMSGTTNVRDGQWHFIAAVYDGTNKYIYVDGVLDAQVNNPHSGAGLGKGTTRYGFIGDGSEATDFNLDRNEFYFEGSLDEISVWHEAKTLTELNEIMSDDIANPATETNLMLYYQFEEGSGQLLGDASSNEYDGQLGLTIGSDDSDPTWKSATSVLKANMGTFDGVDDYGYISNTNDINMSNVADRTIEVWFKCDDITKGSKQVVYEEGGHLNGFSIYVFESELYIGAWAQSNGWDGAYHTSSNIYSNQWHHAALVLDSGTDFTAFLDGEEIGTTNNNVKQLPAHSGDISIGRNGDTQFHDGDDNNDNSFFDGSIDELRIWNEARLLDSIQANMYSELTKPSDESNLVCNSRFNQIGGVNIYDYSINGNPVNISGFTFETSTAPIPYYTVANGLLGSDNTWADGQKKPVKPWSKLNINDEVILDTDFVCSSLKIAQEGSLSINPLISLTVKGNIKNKAGNTGLILKADASGQASLIHKTKNVSATVETHFNLDAHYFASSPIGDAISNIFFDQYMFTWDEPNYEWSNFSNPDEPLVVGKGYDVYNVDQNKAIYAGKLNTGNLSISGLTTTASVPENDRGFNLVGNPYPSCLDIAELDFGANMTAASYVLRHSPKTYYIWSQGSGGDLEARYIQPGQGFFTHVISTGQSLSFENADRTHDGLGPYDKKQDKELSPELLKITITGNNYEDRTYIGFRDEASRGFDHYYDVRKLTGSAESPYVFSYLDDNSKMGINSFPSPTNNDLVPIGVLIPEDGVYTINFSFFESFNEDQFFYLKDRLLNKYYNIREESHIEFTHQEGHPEHRFDLLFKEVTSVDELNQDLELSIYSYNHIIYLSAEHFSSNDKVQFFNVLGQKMGEENISDLGSGVSVDWPSAYYLVKIATEQGLLTQKFYLK